jgi:sulfite reductase alpha subunit-like flavoprotein
LNVRRRDVHGRDHTADHRAGVPATLTDRVVLGDGSRLNTVAVTLTLPRGHRDTEFYKPGDHVSVYPRTSEARARYFVAHFGIDFDDQIELVPLDESEIFENSLDSSIPNPVGAGYLFTTVLDINKEPSAELLQALAHYVDDETCKAQMENLALDEDARREWISQTGARISTLFDQFPTLSATHRRDKAVGIEMLRDILLKIPKLRARYYSVSSSPRAVGNNVFSLTVGRVTYRNGDGVNSHMHLGFCSDFLATLPLRTNVMVEMLPAPAFRLPRSPKVPILMIAGGTGIAPFKGFVDHRACMAPEQRSDAWLIVGCRTRGNQLYRDEMEIAAENGALTAYLVGYSREPDLPKMYVDAVMRENGDGIRDLIKGGGHVYVCGDVRIETSVRGALDDILGRAEVESLEKSGRYHLDIFGAFDVQTSLNQQLKSARRSLSCRKK